MPLTSTRGSIDLFRMYRMFLIFALWLHGGIQSSDFFKMRSVGTVQLSPDGSKVAYTVIRNDVPRRPIGQLWIMTLADGKSICISSGDEPSGNPEWSPDGTWIAYSGKSGLMIARPDGSGKKSLGPLEGTNAPLPTTGKTISWSPDGKRIAYVSGGAGTWSFYISGLLMPHDGGTGFSL